MDLSVSIVSWNTRELLDGCLTSIYETTSDIGFEVIVVDNASSDGSAQMVREKHPQVCLLQNAGNVGFARANNQAYQASTGRCFLLLNPDTIALEGAMEGLVGFLDGNDEAGAVGPLVLNSDRSLQYSWARFPTVWNEVVGRLDRSVDSLPRSPVSVEEVRSLGPFEADWVGGCCLMVKREAIQQIGLMDESLFMYCEETDWCMRLRSAGWKVWVEPAVEILHLGGQSSKQVSAQSTCYLWESKRKYFTKHSGRFVGSVLGLALSAKHCAKGMIGAAKVPFRLRRDVR